jgi:uncharacterized protein YjbI with pentapeptide repeats
VFSNEKAKKGMGIHGMANQEHLDILKQGADAWNQWSYKHRVFQPDLSGADLRELDLHKVILGNANLSGANLSKANLVEANLIDACLYKADLFNAHLDGADLIRANLNGANLSEAYCYKANLVDALLIEANLNGTYLFNANLWNADLTEADLSGANLISVRLADAKLTKARLVGTNLSRANLSGANLRWANLSEANLHKSNLAGCYIYAISAWNVQTQDTTQSGLIISHQDEPTIMVDNLKVAQFIYLLLNNQDIRDVIDTVARKAVLILGRFTPKRKAVLDALREALRTHGYLPILFDFPKPESQDLTGTVSTLANISRFIIADLTDPSCSPYEIGLVAPYMKPIKPLFQPSKAARHEFAMFQDLRKRYSWVLPVYRYKDHESLLASLQEKVIMPAELRAQMLEKKKKR